MAINVWRRTAPLAEFPDIQTKVQKSQVSCYNRHLFACVSFLKVKKKAEPPESYFVLTLGLPAPLESGRVAAKTEPYPGRWTTWAAPHAPGVKPLFVGAAGAGVARDVYAVDLKPGALGDKGT